MEQTRSPYLCILCPLASDTSTPTNKNAYLFDLTAEHMGNIRIIRGLVQARREKGTSLLNFGNVFTLQQSDFSVHVIIYAVEYSSTEYEKLRVDGIFFWLDSRKTNNKCFFFCMIYSNSTWMYYIHSNSNLNDWLQIKEELWVMREKEMSRESGDRIFSCV